MARLYGKNSEIRIPPESTGPRIMNHLYQSVTLTAIGGTVAVGQSIVGQTSSASGTIETVNTDTTTDVLILFDPDSPTQTFTDGETVDINDAAFTATANSPIDTYVNATQLVDGENPHITQKVSTEGSAQIRYSDGEQQLDAFGITRVTQRSLLAVVKQTYGVTDASAEEIVGSASSSWTSDDGALITTTTTGATDSIIRYSHQHFPYIPGVGRELVFTGAWGDTGKTNNTRRIGMFTEDDGVYFELQGTTFNVVLRSSTSGSVVEERVAQADWNQDVLDGTGGINNRSLLTLDITNVNIWWIDYAWLGAGRVRMGIYAPNGDRITCHQFENANNKTTTYMRTGSLPYRQENFNTGVTAGSSTTKIYCAAILDNNDDLTVQNFATHAYVRTGVSVNSETLLVNLRSESTFASLTNRIVSTGLQGSTASVTQPVVVRIYEQATIGGTPSWSAPHTDSPLEVDTAGTFSGGELRAAFMVGVGDTDTNSLAFLKLHTLGDGSTSKTYTVTAESLNGVTDVAFTFTWTDAG